MLQCTYLPTSAKWNPSLSAGGLRGVGTGSAATLNCYSATLHTHDRNPQCTQQQTLQIPTHLALAECAKSNNQQRASMNHTRTSNTEQ